ncbi:uncharacterized protein LOC118433232 [Folsomia candida]|uniref:uncharacterized protein LOC118433232 n=1 Tax=Folsomia candida TaxID=158441 RepID=UPI00160533CF|nr:uncharacterized protein LOC118433232 [Folsomia candida]
MKRNNEQGVSSDPISPPSSAPSSGKCKWLKMDMTAERAASALNNQEGRGMVVERRTERASSNFDPFSLSSLGVSISSLLPPGLASPPRPTRQRSSEFSEILQRLTNASTSTSDTVPNPVDIPQDSEDIVGILTGELTTRPVVRTTPERNMLALMPPLTGPGVAMSGKKRGHGSVSKGDETSSCADKASPFPPEFLPDELETSVNPCSDTKSKLTRNGNLSDSKSGPSSQSTSAFFQVDKSQLKPVNRRPSLYEIGDIEDFPPPRNWVKDPEDSTRLIWNSYRENKKADEASSSSYMKATGYGQPTAASAPMPGLQRRWDEEDGKDDEDNRVQRRSPPTMGIAQLIAKARLNHKPRGQEK